MKKVSVLIILIAFSFSCYCQDSIPVKIPDTAKVTVSKVYNDVKEGLSELASALKVGADHVYGVLVKQQMVYSLTYTIVSLVFILGTLIMFYFWIKDKKSKGEWFGVPLIMTLLTIIIIWWNIGDIVAGFVNPEYGAIKEIIGFVKK